MTLFLAGDVMTGRGVDQILSHPSEPWLREHYIRDARDYVSLAEEANGPITKPVDMEWPWGDALPILDVASPDARLINLETSVTQSGDYARGKGIHYRMNPDNIGCLTAAGIGACALANNHVLDFGERGLEDTLDTLTAAGICTAGAGSEWKQAWQPAVIDTPAGRILMWSVALTSSGVSPSNAAGPNQPGLAFLPELSDASAKLVIEAVRQVRHPGDLAVFSVHWGSNWGYGIPDDQIGFAHDLVDAGIDIVHGHSSHHPRPIEMYRGKPIFYGCGDLINDYEGISGNEQFRDDLRLLYLVTVDVRTHKLRDLRMIPMQARQLRLHRAAAADAEWLCRTLNDISASFGARFIIDDGELLVR
ncbi:MAG TPA: CapA family protein [Arthrobacter sp.]|nr:CapA family protein [Arthrobacter sp.]